MKYTRVLLNVLTMTPAPGGGGLKPSRATFTSSKVS